MKNILLVIVGLLSLNLHAQDKRMEYYTYKWVPTSENRAKIIREIIKQNDTLYTVTEYQKKGRLYMKGEYSSVNPMIENGFFEFYDFFDFTKKATGYYRNGVMTGDWYLADDNGIIKKVNYDSVLTHKEMFDYKELLDYIKADSNTALMIDEFSRFQGSKDLESFSKYVKENSVYPPMAVRHQKEGLVVVLCTINELGQIGNINVRNKVYKDLEREAIRVISQCPNWIPAYYQGKPISSTRTLRIGFKLKGW